MMRIDGNTRLIAHIGWPTSSFTAPLIYNPWFAASGINAAVVPMGVRAEDFANAFPAITRLTNFHGALITMPHKIAVVTHLDQASQAVVLSGCCNAVTRGADGRLAGDMFDGEGFLRAMQRKGRMAAGARALIVGCGGVGSAIAAALAGAGLAAVTLRDPDEGAMARLAARLAASFPALAIATGRSDPEGHDIVINASPLGMAEGDALPLDVSRLTPAMHVGEVVLKPALTPLLAAAQARGCTMQAGVDMLFEQIPAYLEFFGFPSTTPDELRRVAGIG